MVTSSALRALLGLPKFTYLRPPTRVTPRHTSSTATISVFTPSPLALELQITKEYLGEQVDALWDEILARDSHAEEGRG